MKTIPLTVLTDGRTWERPFDVRRVVNAGYVCRDQQAVQAHIEELRREGVPPPPAVPMLFPVASDNLTTAGRIEVSDAQTSGEVEYVLLLDQGEVFVGVGSDHTDRALERQSLVKSKQICKNVLSAKVWRYQDVQGHWDDLLMQSWVKARTIDKEILYQKACLRSILAPDELLDLVRSRMRDRQCDGLVIFSGTVPLLNGEVSYGDYFRGELIDPRSERRLACEYRVGRLDYLKDVEECP